MICHITCSTGRSAVSKEISLKTEDSNTSKKSSPLSHTLSQTIVFEKHETNWRKTKQIAAATCLDMPDCLFWTLDNREGQSSSLSMIELKEIVHLSRSWSIGWVALSFLVRSLFDCPAMVTSDQIFTFFSQYIQAKKPCTNPIPLNTNRYQVILTQYQVRLTQYHQVPASTEPYWPSTTKY